MATLPRIFSRRTHHKQRLDLYRTVADFTYDLEVWITPGGRLRYVSPSCLRITGYTPEEATADDNFFLRIIAADDYPRWRAAMDASHAGDTPSMDFRIQRKDDREIWLAQETTRVFAPRGLYRGVRLSLRDVTDRVRIRVSLDQARQHLEERVRERTAELEDSREQYRALSTYLQDSIEKERTRISREIHDVLGQDLTALNMGLHRLERSWSPGDEALRQIFELRELVAGTLGTVRRISRELRPPMLDELGFAEAVAWRCRTFAEATGLNVVYRLGKLPSLPPDTATALYRVLQETLTNAARHSGASRLDVVLSRQRSLLLLRMRDNGRGIEPHESESSSSLGIIGMRERIRQIGGTLDINRPKKGGTEIMVRTPLTGGQ
jgi:PAS domain S-box-containing protein